MDGRWLVQCLLVVILVTNIGARRKRGFLLNRSRPNIIFVLADDLDVALGSTTVMKKTKKILQDEGVTFKNAFTTSPLCCPSRSSILTGRYAHNHDVNTNNKNCSGPAWVDGPEKETVGKFMQDAGYTTAYFGKYLNNYDGGRVPPGWNEWSGLIRNSRYYSYSLNVNGRIEEFKRDYTNDYFTDVMSRRSIAYFKRHIRHSLAPLFMVVSMAAPHGPEDAAPQYQNLFENIQAPRYPNYNYTSRDKHWIIRHTPPLSNVTSQFTDLLYRKRLQTLMSLDDYIERLYIMLHKIEQVDNTYVIFSSDHGYHLGQFNQVKGKSQPYESDVRIPFYIRGPKIPKGVEASEIALNIDFVPTFLDIARGKIPKSLDGQSVMDIAVGQVINMKKRKVHKPIWRDTFLIERGKMHSLTRSEANDTVERLVFHSTKKVHRMCTKQGFPKPPCSDEKEFICHSQNGSWYLERCNKNDDNENDCFCNEKTALLGNDQTYTLLLELQKQFEKLYMRIKRHGIKAIHRMSQKRAPTVIDLWTMNSTKQDLYQEQQQNYSYGNRILNTTSPTERNTERNDYFQKEKLKLSRNRVLANELTRSLTQKVDQIQNSTQSECFCNGSNSNTTGINGIDQINRKSKLKKRKKSKEGRHMNCFSFDKEHWKNPPYWTGPAFTACTNTPNSSYWCLRTINSTHNFLYCEFVTGFKEYFDVNKDPYQLVNIIHTIPFNIQEQLQADVEYLKSCQSAKGCFFTAGESLIDRKDTLRKIRRYERRKRNGILIRGSFDMI